MESLKMERPCDKEEETIAERRSRACEYSKAEMVLGVSEGRGGAVKVGPQ